MGLGPSKQTIAGYVPKIYKWFELYAGGFAVVSTNFQDGVTLPAGSLLKVDEATRQATPVKSAVAKQATGVTQGFWFEKDHHFKVGDVISRTIGGTARKIRAITASGEYDVIQIQSGGVSGATRGHLGNIRTDTVFYHAATGGATGTLFTTPNTLSFHDVKVGTTLQEFVSALRRGTVYKRRIQPHLAGHLTGLPATIQISESF